MEKINTFSAYIILIGLTVVINCISTKNGPEVVAADTNEYYYTAYNIWYEDSYKIYAINYKTGQMLPAGARVKFLGYGQERLPYFEFRVLSENRVFRMHLQPRHQSDLTIQQVKERTLTKKDFSVLTANFTDREKTAIRAGKIITGMSKDAVIVSFGYPPKFRTPDLSLNLWIYWRNRWKEMHVAFGENNKTLEAPDF